jgi:hypothetical protein
MVMLSTENPASTQRETYAAPRKMVSILSRVSALEVRTVIGWLQVPRPVVAGLLLFAVEAGGILVCDGVRAGSRVGVSL